MSAFGFKLTYEVMSETNVDLSLSKKETQHYKGF